MTGINSNFSSLFAGRIHAANESRIQNSLLRLATGKRLNSAADGPADLITSENLKAVLAFLDAETRAMERTVHVSATADGVLAEVSGMLAEANALAVANANTGGMSDEEIAANQMQYDSLMSTINRLTGGATFNGDALFDGGMTLEAGGGSHTIDQVSTGTLGLTNAIDQDAIQNAISQVSTMRGSLGAFQKYTVGSRINSLQIEFENIAAANSKLEDTDFARETSELVNAQLLSLASLRAMVIGGEQARSVLSLLA